jgi:hypothetical protein
MVSRLEDIEFGGILGAQLSRIHKIFSKVTSAKAYEILLDGRSWRGEDNESMGLLKLLNRYLSSKCSNPRDRAYAMLRFELEKEGFDLRINYSAPLHKVFLDVAQYIILCVQRLDILGLYKGPLHVLPLPSRVPDWQLSSNFCSSLTYLGYSWMDRNYDASAKSTTSISFSPWRHSIESQVHTTRISPYAPCLT